MVEYDSIKVKDQLGRPEDKGIFVKRFTDTVVVQELSTSVSSQLIYSGTGDSFILGHTVNGVLGVANGMGGNQILLGDFRAPLVLERVVNPNNTFNEYFLTTDFKSGTTNANWDTTNHKLVFTFPAGSIAQSGIFALNSETYTTVTVYLDGDATANLVPYISFNGGNSFEQVTASTAYVTGSPNSTGLVWRVESTGSGTATHLKIEYA